jgi:chromosomal replication initiation ATPase DnaA
MEKLSISYMAIPGIRPLTRKSKVQILFQKLQQLTGITRLEVCNGSRRQELSDARKMLASIMYNFLGMKHSAIGLELGLDRTSVIAALKKHNALMFSDKFYSQQYYDLQDAFTSYIE